MSPRTKNEQPNIFSVVQIHFEGLQSTQTNAGQKQYFSSCLMDPPTALPYCELLQHSIIFQIASISHYFSSRK